MEKLRRSVNSRTPYGGEEWQIRISNKLGLVLTMNPRGRPEKGRVGKVACPLYGPLSPLWASDTVLQHRVRILDAVYGDRVTTALDNIVNSPVPKLNQSYEAFSNAIYADLLIQTHFQKYLDAVELSITDTSISIDTSKVSQMFQDRIASNPVNGLTDLIEFNKYAGDMLYGTEWDGLGMMEKLEMLRNGIADDYAAEKRRSA